MNYKRKQNCTAISTGNSGYIDYQLSNGQILRHAFGIIGTTSTVNFSPAFSEIIWAISSDASTGDAQSQRSTIKTISNTSITFVAGANVPVRWEAWGIL